MEKPGMIHCGFVTDLKVGVAEHNSGVGMVMEFSPTLSLPSMAVILTPGQAVSFRKTLQRMEKQFGWTESTKPSMVPPDLVNHLKK
jgi:hypothetical protein